MNGQQRAEKEDEDLGSGYSVQLGGNYSIRIIAKRHNFLTITKVSNMLNIKNGSISESITFFNLPDGIEQGLVYLLSSYGLPKSGIEAPVLADIFHEKFSKRNKSLTLETLNELPELEHLLLSYNNQGTAAEKQLEAVS